ncbi:hypothetical protein N7516_003149 [Penicillium verrucosum]|uniref:uncharacterized protein n=1 Tax=Penicillium verrucosum TaxID=60171 RepID=UPI002545A497|nr:uncharacterized protein N7516_003149 [Penicillium verrucosum]KAJ5942981.1 hypothetical protein N7516_003149 [Penicillium verrucosum]
MEVGWRIEAVATSLPIVLKPKPATVRLVEIEVDGRCGGWMIEVGWRIEVVATSLPIVLKPKPATARLVGIGFGGGG